MVKRRGVWLIVVMIFLGTLAGCSSMERTRWWKGNLHTHSLWSDGDDYPEMIVGWYRDNGYDFIGLSDHNVLAEGERWIDVEASRGGRPAFEARLVLAATLSPSYANYRRYLLEAARGDGAALGRLMSLRLDGAGFDAHATNLESLLLGLGDAVFAEALAGQTPEAKTATFAALDFAQQLGPDDPKHYRHSHPKTFALQPPAEP